MNDRYLFRGKRIDKNQFVEGDLIHGVGSKKGKIFILPLVVNIAYCEGAHPLDGYEVIPETLGQFTGLTDKNGVKIFEGDHFGSQSLPVYFSNGMFLLAGLPLKGYLNGEYMEQVSKVIGNIYEA